MIIRRPEGNTLEKIKTEVDWAGAVNYVEMLPSDMAIDDTHLGVDGGSLWNLTECFDFWPDEVGSIWWSFNFPQRWSIERSIYLNIYYSIDGIDHGKHVILENRIWLVTVGADAELTSPNITATETIQTSISNSGKFSKKVASNAVITADDLLSKDLLVCGKLTRRGDTDNYGGTFKLLKVIARQIEGGS